MYLLPNYHSIYRFLNITAYVCISVHRDRKWSYLQHRIAHLSVVKEFISPSKVLTRFFVAVRTVIVHDMDELPLYY